MNIPLILYHLMRADFLERVRRYSFLITVGLTMFVGYAYLPPLDSTYLTLGLGSYRGVYNSAWVGSAIALLTSTLLTLPGFYLIKNAIERDQQTGVGEIIATTPLNKVLYLLGKMVSNFAYLLVMVLVIALSAVVIQLVRGEDRSLDLWALLSPFLFITLPMMAVVAALAILFETISWLRGGFGNIVYFIVWMVILLLSVGNTDPNNPAIYLPSYDPGGTSIILASMTKSAVEAFPQYSGNFSIGAASVEGHVQTFVWQGVQWTAGLIAMRLVWFLAAVGITLFASLFFRRFDPSSEKRRAAQPQEVPAPVPEEREVGPALPQVHLGRLTSADLGFRFDQMMVAEMRLMLKGQPWWWYAVAAVLIVVSLVVPVDVLQRYLLPFIWVWPILIWSQLGTREAYYNTNQLIFSAPQALRRQLPALWLSGLLVAFVIGIGVLVRFALAGNAPLVLAWVSGALFIPTLAITLGVWSGTSKLFEASYMILWYLGPINDLEVFNFLGTSAGALARNIPLYYLIVTLVLAATVVVGRQRQLQV